MTKLQKLQEKFSSQIIEGAGEKITSEISEHPSISKEGLFGVYINNYFLGLRKVMENTFPAIKGLVGEKFFNGTVKEFAKQNPPTSGNLDDYGVNFPEFLKGFEPAKQLSYLPDVADFEWKYHCCLIADISPYLQAEQLSAFSPEDYAILKFKFNPSIQFFKSDFPVLKMWQANQQNDPDRIDLEKEKGDLLLMVKKNQEVRFIPLESSENSFIKSLSQGNFLADAYEYVSQDDEVFDLAFVINKHIVSGTWVSIIKEKE